MELWWALTSAVVSVLQFSLSTRSDQANVLTRIKLVSSSLICKKIAWSTNSDNPLVWIHWVSNCNTLAHSIILQKRANESIAWALLVLQFGNELLNHMVHSYYQNTHSIAAVICSAPDIPSPLVSRTGPNLNNTSLITPVSCFTYRIRQILIICLTEISWVSSIIKLIY